MDGSMLLQAGGMGRAEEAEGWDREQRMYGALKLQWHSGFLPLGKSQRAKNDVDVTVRVYYRPPVLV